MKSLKLNSEGDIDVTAGKLSFVTGLDAIVQNLKTRLSTFFGEWFLDKNEGVPYFEQILKKDANPVLVEQIIINTIITTPGVTELISITLDVDTTLRSLSISFGGRANEKAIKFNNFIVSI